MGSHIYIFILSNTNVYSSYPLMEHHSCTLEKSSRICSRSVKLVNITRLCRHWIMIIPFFITHHELLVENMKISLKQKRALNFHSFSLYREIIQACHWQLFYSHFALCTLSNRDDFARINFDPNKHCVVLQKMPLFEHFM